MIKRAEILLGAVALLLSAGLSAADPISPTLTDDAIQSAVRELGADEYGVRATAGERLIAHADERILATLARARIETADPEIRAQADRLSFAVKKTLGEKLFVKDLWMIGPFPYSESDTQRALYVETPLETAAVIDLNGELPQSTDPKNPGEKLRWSRPFKDGRGSIDLKKHFEKTQTECVNAYFLTFVRAERPTRAVLVIGSNDGLGVWVNGRTEAFNNDFHALFPDQYSVTTDFDAGWNPVLLRISQSKGGWGLSFRVTDADHRPWPAKDIDAACAGEAMPAVPRPVVPPEP